MINNSKNKRAFDIIGYCPMEVLSTSLYDLVHFEDIEKLTECHKKCNFKFCNYCKFCILIFKIKYLNMVKK